MKSLDFGRFVLGGFAAAAMLAGCGASQPPIGVPGTMPESQRSAIATQAGRGGSWMLPEAKSKNLLYAPGGCGGTCVLSAAGGNVVGSLNQYGDAACSDSAGDVFLVQDDDVLEYAHGGSSPIATFTLPGDLGSACSVDPSSGALAVVFEGSDANVAVFPYNGDTPTLYGSHIVSLFCGYDANGDLFVDGYLGQNYALAMLPKGTSTFAVLSVDYSMGQPGQLQWDGTYMTYEARFEPVRVSRFTVSGSTVNIVGVTKIADLHKRAVPSWIRSGKIFIPYPNHGTETKQLGEWNYPKGGKQIKRFNFGSYQSGLNLQAITYSAATN